MASTNRPSPSGPRLSGDRYQHLFTWLYSAKMLVAGSDIVRVEFEIKEAGNIDDLVLVRIGQPPLYHQIKFVTSQEEPLNAEWFTRVSRGSTKSPLQRFRDSFQSMSDRFGEPPEMVLLTNRWPESDDPLR